MKQFLLYSLFLLIGHLNTFGFSAPLTDDVKPLDLLKPTLTIKANVYFGREDEEVFPIARTEFYLLDKSLVDILKDSKFKLEFTGQKKHKIQDEDYLSATANAFSSFDEESQLLTLLIQKEIAKHQIYAVKTNFQGKAQIDSVKMGNYFLFGIGKTEDEIFVWHLPVTIKSGENLIELDQNNAETVLSIED